MTDNEYSGLWVKQGNIQHRIKKLHTACGAFCMGRNMIMGIGSLLLLRPMHGLREYMQDSSPVEKPSCVTYPAEFATLRAR